MAHKHREAHDVVSELNSSFDRLAAWGVRNRIAVGIAAALILAAAAGYGFNQSASRRAEKEASAALGAVANAYRQAMGADPYAPTIAEPANAELAERVRKEFSQNFLEVARDHPGTSAAVVAQLNAGNRLAEAGDPEGAQAAFEAARDSAPSGSSLRGLALVRLARAHEAAGRAAAAASAFEQAGDIASFPLRYAALAHAARNFATAGETTRAITLFERIEAEAQDAPLPDHVRSRLRELRESAQSGSVGAPSDS